MKREVLDFYVNVKKFLELFDTREILVIDFLCFLWEHGELYQRTTMVSMVTKFQTWELWGRESQARMVDI